MASQAVIQPLSKGGIAFFSSLCIGTFGLGSWQAKRYFEKIELVQLRHDELQMIPISLGDNVYCSLEERIVGVDVDNNTKGKIITDGSIIAKEEDDTKRGFRTVTTKGRFMHEYEILVGPRGPPPGAISNSGPNSGRSSGGMSSSPQGYYVITPFHRISSTANTTTTTNTNTNTTASTVLVNRGWVPRQYVQQNAAWDRPDGIVNIVGVMSKTEQPKFFSPPHSAKDPNQLLWMDRQAMEEKTNTIGLSPLLLTQTDTTSTTLSTKDSMSMTTSFPVKPSKETVGEFKVLPSTHAGYAFTWFGLSSAGIFMTRKLITRGRA